MRYLAYIRSSTDDSLIDVRAFEAGDDVAAIGSAICILAANDIDLWQDERHIGLLKAKPRPVYTDHKS